MPGAMGNQIESAGKAIPRVLLVDDEPLLRQALSEYLGMVGYDIVEAGTRREAEAAMLRGGFDAAVFDFHLPDGNAHDLLAFRREQEIDLAAVILTGHGTIDLAVTSLKQGAEHFLTKPVKMAALAVVLERVIEQRRVRRQSLYEQERAKSEPFDPFLGSSKAIRRLHQVAERVARSSSPIRIHGETGTGKGVLARWLHEHGPRAEEAFVEVNCAGLSPEFLDSELFGHQKGAFTGATTNKQGLLEAAHRGTVFLDEIGDIDVRVQPKLLKALEEKRFRRMGDVREREVSIRLIAASHQDLQALVKKGKFREDLYFRISTLPIAIPPLRERTEDIPALAENILARLVAEMGRPASLSAGAVERLQGYDWPGNIRELRNVLERSLLVRGAGELRPQDFLFETLETDLPADDGDDVEMTLQEVERRHIERLVQGSKKSIARISRDLGISRTTLYEKIKTYGIEVPAS